MDKQLFDLLKTPQQLNWLEAALIRDGIQERQEFEKAYGVSVEGTAQILFAWEAAQSSEWDRELLCQFIDPEIFPDRRIVQLRVEAAMPQRFTPTAGLHWLKQERIPVGDLDEWVRHNTASPAPVVEAPEPLRPVSRASAQDDAILKAIRAADCDPLALPKNEPGKPGVKAAVRLLLVGKNPAFPKVGTQFEKAWDRLRSFDEIGDAV